jgi:hypothetical protein
MLCEPCGRSVGVCLDAGGGCAVAATSCAMAIPGPDGVTVHLHFRRPEADGSPIEYYDEPIALTGHDTAVTAMCFSPVSQVSRPHHVTLVTCSRGTRIRVCLRLCLYVGMCAWGQ